MKVGIIVGLLLVASACGNTADVGPDTGVNQNGGASACLEGDLDCEDTFPDSGEPAEPPSPGVPVADVVATNIDGGFAITGFYYADDSGARLCEALAESFPPQCAAASIAFDNSAGANLGPLTIEQGVTWSDQPVLVVGRVVDGAFVAD